MLNKSCCWFSPSTHCVTHHLQQPAPRLPLPICDSNEPTEEGYPTCPVLRVHPDGKRACRRTLVLCASRIDGGANNEGALVGNGDATLRIEQWEEAVNFFERAYEADGQSDRQVHISQSSLSPFQVIARLQKAQRLRKNKDSYKVLDAAWDADTRTIKKALFVWPVALPFLS